MIFSCRPFDGATASDVDVAAEGDADAPAPDAAFDDADVFDVEPALIVLLVRVCLVLAEDLLVLLDLLSEPALLVDVFEDGAAAPRTDVRDEPSLAIADVVTALPISVVSAGAD